MGDIYRTEIPTGVLFTPISLSASGTLVIGVAGKKILVLSAWLVAAAAVGVEFQTSTGTAAITGAVDCAQNGGFVLNFNAGGWFQTLTGDSLLLNLSSNVVVGGSLSYALV